MFNPHTFHPEIRARVWATIDRDPSEPIPIADVRRMDLRPDRVRDA